MESGMFVLQRTRGSWFPYFRGLTRARYSFSLSPSLSFRPLETKGTACAHLGRITAWGRDAVRACAHLLAFRTTSAPSRLEVAWNIFWRSLFPQKPSFQLWQLSLHNTKITSLLLCSPPRHLLCTDYCIGPFLIFYHTNWTIYFPHVREQK